MILRISSPFVDHNASANLLGLLLGWKAECEHGNATPNGPDFRAVHILFAFFGQFRARSLLNSQFTNTLELSLSHSAQFAFAALNARDENIH